MNVAARITPERRKALREEQDEKVQIRVLANKISRDTAAFVLVVKNEKMYTRKALREEQDEKVQIRELATQISRNLSAILSKVGAVHMKAFDKADAEAKAKTKAKAKAKAKARGVQYRERCAGYTSGKPCKEFCQVRHGHSQQDCLCNFHMSPKSVKKPRKKRKRTTCSGVKIDGIPCKQPIDSGTHGEGFCWRHKDQKKR